jgi:methionyl-tRNA formyltransferase
VAHAILRGEKRTGVTTLLMDAGIDTGPLLLQEEDSLGETESAGEVEDRLSHLGAGLLTRTLSEMERGTLRPRPQTVDRATYAPKLGADQARLDWRREAVQLARQIRAFNPRPGASTSYHGLGVKVWRASECSHRHEESPMAGTLLCHQGSLHVVCTAGTCLLIKEIQLEGRNRVTGEEALRGRWFTPGDAFGDAIGTRARD